MWDGKETWSVSHQWHSRADGLALRRSQFVAPKIWPFIFHSLAKPRSSECGRVPTASRCVCRRCNVPAPILPCSQRPRPSSQCTCRLPSPTRIMLLAAAERQNRTEGYGPSRFRLCYYFFSMTPRKRFRAAQPPLSRGRFLHLRTPASAPRLPSPFTVQLSVSRLWEEIPGGGGSCPPDSPNPPPPAGGGEGALPPASPVPTPPPLPPLPAVAPSAPVARACRVPRRG